MQLFDLIRLMASIRLGKMGKLLYLVAKIITLQEVTKVRNNIKQNAVKRPTLF